MKDNISSNSNAYIKINDGKPIIGFFLKAQKLNWLFIPNYKISDKIKSIDIQHNLKDSKRIKL